MTRATIETEIRGVAHRAPPRRRPATANRIALDGAWLIAIGVLATLGLIGFAGIGAELAAVGPPPVAGPAPGFP